MDKLRKKKERRNKIRKRIRSTIRGTEKKPRMSVYKSSKHTYAQLIDDINGNTLAAASTLSKELADDISDKEGVEQAKLVGQYLAKKAKDADIDEVVFDRGGYKYHGKVKALAEGAREKGLQV